MSTVISMVEEVPPITPRSPFSQRLTYYEELCRTGTPHEAWQRPVLETVHQYLRGTLGAVLHSLKEIVAHERDGIKTNSNKQALAGYIRDKLQDIGFQEAFSTVQDLVNQNHQPKSPEKMVECYQVMGVQVLGYVLLLLHHPASIAEALCSPETAVLASQIHISMTNYGSPEPTLKYYSDVYYCHLALVGLAAIRPIEQANACKLPASLKLIS